MSIIRKKLLDQSPKDDENGLKKTLSAFDLMMIGVGAIIGVGIFVITGTTAAKYSGPAITVSFVLAGLVVIFTALAYAELAAMLPVAGGAYSYSYAVLGEVFAWMAGSLVLMFNLFGAAAVASGWSSYVTGILDNFGIDLPREFLKVPYEGGMFNLPAILITWLISSILVKGTKESAVINNILVFVKLGAIILFIFAAVPHFDIKNWDNFMPHGMDGVLIGTGALFLAYGGFDVVASAAEECKNPNRDLPIGLIASVLLCALLYVIVSGLLTGIVPYYELNNAEPLAYALKKNGSSIGGLLVAIGGITGMTTVMMMQIFGISRILYSMSRDGMVPKLFGKLHRRFATPYAGIFITAFIVSCIAGFLPIKTLGNVASMSAIGSFIFVSICVMKMRIEQPELKRPFKCPGVFVTASISVISSAYLLFDLIKQDGDSFGLCIVISLMIYVLYGYKNSNLKNQVI